MSLCDSDSGLSISIDGSSVAMSGQQGCKIEIKVPDLNIKKKITVNPSESVIYLKKMLLASIPAGLNDSMNYGLFVPPTTGKAGKFLLEERQIKDYGIVNSENILELRYKRRLYKAMGINISKLKKIHSKSNLKTFLDYVGCGDTTKVLKMLNKGLDPNFQMKDTGETPLIRACALNQPCEMIKILVECGAHLDYRHSNGQTPLHAAATLGNLEAVKMILDLGQSPNTCDLEGLTPLYLNIINDPSAACAERLLYDYSIIGINDENGLQEIHQACRFGRVQHVEYLLQYGADLNCQTGRHGNTPLHICAYLNQESCTRLLLFRGANRLIINRAGHTPFQQALMSHNKDIALLIQHYRDEDIVPVKPNPKYNNKRKVSRVSVECFHRSKSASKLAESEFPESESSHSLRDDSWIHSQANHNKERQKLCDTRSFRQPAASTVSKSTGKQQQQQYRKRNGSYGGGSSRSIKSLSRSVTELDLAEPCNGNQGGWWAEWDRDDVDSMPSDEQVDGCIDDDDVTSETVSSVMSGGPMTRGRRRNTAASAQDCSKQKARSHSAKRRNSKEEISDFLRIDPSYLPRMVVLQRTSQGFGFVIRGLKANSSIEFAPTAQHPALQYFEEIEPNSVASRAGLMRGDFILEVNLIDVTVTSHEETVRLIKSSGDMLSLKVVTVDKSIQLSRKNSHRKSGESQDQVMSTFSRQLSSNSSQIIPPPAFDNHNPTVIATSSSTRARRNTTPTIMVRPESIISTDSYYPMPPPPNMDTPVTHPATINEIDEFCTLKKRISPQKFSINNIPPPPTSNLPLQLPFQHNIPPPPTSNLPPQMPFQHNIPQPPSMGPVKPPPSSAPLAPPPPPSGPPAPPPPPAASKPFQITTKPSTKPNPPPSQNSQPTFEFDSHLRQAIAKRRQKIDNDDQISIASSTVDSSYSSSNVRTTLSALKHHTNQRAMSNRWNNPNPNPNNTSKRKSLEGEEDPQFQRTQSDVYSQHSSSTVGRHKSVDHKPYSKLYPI